MMTNFYAVSKAGQGTGDVYSNSAGLSMLVVLLHRQYVFDFLEALGF
jgi:hypothetical protein